MPACARRTRSALLAIAIAALARPSLAAPPYVWIEGEATTSANMKVSAAGWGREEFLSGRKWLHLSIDADKVEQELPAGGGLLSYSFDVPTAGTWEVWNRVGFEFVRSPFEWRIDEGAWAPVKPDALTTDLMEIAEWCEVAWLRLGKQDLAAGRHTLTIRLPHTKDDKGKPARVLYASDALCLTLGEFHPHSFLKPGEKRRSAQDEEAAKQVFQLPAPGAPGARSSVALKGLWEVCRHDEELPGPDVAVPMSGLPADPLWTAIPVPGNKNSLRPDLLFAHRLWYRTRVNVPQGCEGRSFYIRFPQNSLNTTVVVNGVPCGFHKNPFALFDIDITKGVKPGANEVLVGIRDAWYAYSTNPTDPMKLRRRFNLPLRYFGEGFQDLAYPVWNHAQSGILFTPELVCAGNAYTADTFVKPSVARKELVVETDVVAPVGAAAQGEVVCEAVDPQTGAVAHRLPPVAFQVAAGQRQRVKIRGPWADPKLWWPDKPRMYNLRITLKSGGTAIDVAETPFGFREWTIDGTMFRLNGVVWRLWADLKDGKTPEEWLANYRRTGQRMQRFWGVNWMGMSPDDALGFFDRNGVVIRRSGILDGEAIGYFAIENDPDLKRLHGSDIKMDLMRNWRDQMVAQVKGERNHPSVMIWSIENEWLYINCINLYGGMMDAFEKEVQITADAVREADPTRPVMNDGGGAHRAQTMPVHGDHYVFEPGNGRYPDLAYEANPKAGGRGRWEWDQKRPRFLGEDYFANGINPFDYAYYGGEAAFEGKAAARPAAGVVARMLNEGYRWAGYAAWHFWMGSQEAVNQYGANSPRAALCREWNWTFGPGQKVARTFRVYNDTQYAEPIVFSWQLSFGAKPVQSDKVELRVPPGEFIELRRSLTMPSPVKAGMRLDGKLTLSLAVAGKDVFNETKGVSVLGPLALAPAVKALGAGSLYVYDPGGKVVAYLKGQELAFTVLANLDALPAAARVLVIGPDALDDRTSTTSRLAAWASAGRRLLVLEQRSPLRYQGLPAAVETTDHEGRTAYIEDAAHPVCAGLQSRDLWTWGVNVPVYRSAYGKPSRGARSLIQCHARLADSALLEAPVGQGVVLLCQLTVGANLSSNAVARRLFDNMLRRAAGYELALRNVTSFVGSDALFSRTLGTIGLRHTPSRDALSALANPGPLRLAIVEATPDSLKQMAGHLPAVRAFTDAGGWIVLHGLTPDGLGAYNEIVGFDHMIRPFRMERVTLPPRRSALTAGLTLTDVVMYNGERIFGWTSDEFLAPDIFSYCVDYADVAPFGKMPSDYHYNIVNGMYSADAWKYIFSFDLNTDRPEFTMTLPKVQEVERMDWAGNAFYHLVTRVSLSTETGQTATFATKPNNEEQTFEISPPFKGKVITLKILEWDKVSTGANVVGIDNLRLYAKRQAGFLERVRPLVNVGGMMEYRMGKGGLVLCNLLVKEREAVPVNAQKKRRILSTLLANLQAPFAGGAAVIAGSRLEYEPIDISRNANQYRNERGWFGDRAFTLADLPAGGNTYAGVPFVVHEFPTSPVPTVIMLGGDGVPGNLPDAVRDITINRKADALFFMLAARADRPLADWEKRDRKRAELCRYLIHYADGQTVELPIYLGEDVDSYKQNTPRALPGAQIAWTRPYAGGEYQAVLYVKQWDNPRPGVAIKSVDLTYGAERRGVPALVALTAATVPVSRGK